MGRCVHAPEISLHVISVSLRVAEGTERARFSSDSGNALNCRRTRTKARHSNAKRVRETSSGRFGRYRIS